MYIADCQCFLCVTQFVRYPGAWTVVRTFGTIEDVRPAFVRTFQIRIPEKIRSRRAVRKNLNDSIHSDIYNQNWHDAYTI